MVVGEFTQETELVVIGGGPAGYAAAFRAADLEVPTLLIDAQAELGGVCLHHGCIGSKTLLHVTDSIDLARRSGHIGVTFGDPTIDLERVRAWVGEIVGGLARSLEGLCTKHGVERLRGTARFEDSRSLAIRDGTVPRVRFRRAILATGSRPAAHHHLPFDAERVWSAEHAVTLPEVPATLLVVGATYMAVELASIYASLGSSVTLVSEHERMIAEADVDLARPLHRSMQSRLDAITLGAAIDAAEITDEALTVTIGGEPRRFDRAIVAIGQIGNTAELDLDRTSVSVDDEGYVAVDEQLRTTDPRIHAVGDVTGRPLMANKGLWQGRVCAEAIAGWGSRYDPRTVPMTVFTDPQLAWCGLTELEAVERGIPHRVRTVPWGASGRAAGMDRPEGLTKLIFDPDTDLVLGVGITGPHATEMIGEGALAIEMGAVLTDLAATIHPHPSMIELLSTAAQAEVE